MSIFSAGRDLRNFGRIAFAFFFLLPGAVGGQSALKRFPSPHGKYVIEAVTRDPGGVGAPQTIVSMHRSRNKVATYQNNILVVEGEHPVSVEWVPGDALVAIVTCEGCDIESPVLKIGKFEDVVIQYRTHAPEAKPAGSERKPSN